MESDMPPPMGQKRSAWPGAMRIPCGATNSMSSGRACSEATSLLFFFSVPHMALAPHVRRRRALHLWPFDGGTCNLADKQGVVPAPFDRDGVLHLLATMGNSRPYRNPHQSGMVVASMSSCPDAVEGWAGGHPRRFVQGAPCTCCVLQVFLFLSFSLVHSIDCDCTSVFATSCLSRNAHSCRQECNCCTEIPAGIQLPHCHCILLPAVDTCACRGAPPAPVSRALISCLALKGTSRAGGDPCKGSIHDGGQNHTKDLPGSWMAVDLKRQLAPTFYCMRSGMDNGDFKLRHWRLEASNDAVSWCLAYLSSHTRARVSTSCPPA
eukprot:Tamp_06958.p1 GENE.Tamp_06958~~Tamp_06958.p1  ORF type:complete len:322 (-),score=24.35 Tamp_06958:1199-2164(-)